MARYPKDDVVFSGVFQHTAENCEKLRETIVDDVFLCTGNALLPGVHPRLNDLRKDLGEELYVQLRSKYKQLLHHGYYFRLTSGWTLLDWSQLEMD